MTFDSLLTKEEIEVRNANIERHTFYCLHVKGAIEDGVEPLSWDEWSIKEQRFVVDAFTSITNKDIQNIANDITAMYDVPFKKDH